LALLDINGFTSGGYGLNKISLAAQKSGRLQYIHNVCNLG
jgi:hypothetical protein